MTIYRANEHVDTLGHQISGDDCDVRCECGWYNHDPDPSVDRSATAHILRAIAHDLADEYEAEYRELFA